MFVTHKEENINEKQTWLNVAAFKKFNNNINYEDQAALCYRQKPS